MNFVVGVPLIGWGIFMLFRREQFAVSASRFHQRIAKVLPLWGWGNPNLSLDFNRVMLPVVAVAMIIGGAVALFLIPFHLRPT
jgi:hypothetical protein